MKSDFDKKQLTKKTSDTPRWYTEVIQLAELADYGPARGTMVIRPYGYAIWETIQEEFDKLIEALGVENAYFPLLIPMQLLQKEKEHVRGFAPELAVVTHGGGKKLKEPLAVRPTSETIMYEMYSKWISSWRDLPLKINQWNNVVRWEKRTYFFLRTLEFLWQEGHTAHESYDEAEQMTKDALSSYEKLYKEIFAMPGLCGVKSQAEKFAGADHTYAIEFLMPDGKVLQGATSHHLGDNFSKVFNIKFQDKNGEIKNVFQTSWGLSTRSIGGMILMHGDDNGLVIPPKLSPIKVIIIPILGKKDENILKYCEKLKQEIERINSEYSGKVKIDKEPGKSIGWKINEAEIKGIPVRVLVGIREVDEKTATLNSRLIGIGDLLCRQKEIGEKVEGFLNKIQDEMYKRAVKFLKGNIIEVKNYEDFKSIMKSKRGFIKAFWCENADCETNIKEETKATTRLKPLNAKKEYGKCIYCGKKAQYVWYFGQAY